MCRTEEVQFVLTEEYELVVQTCVSSTVLHEEHSDCHVCRTQLSVCVSVCLSVADILSATEPCRIFMKFGRAIVCRIWINREFLVNRLSE